MEVRFCVLGSLEVTVDGEPLALPAGRPRRLLAMLALRAGEVVSADALVDALWDGRPTASSRKALQVHVSQLRRALPDGRLVTRENGYALRVSAEELDALAFARDLEVGHAALTAGDPRHAAERLGRALARWRRDDLVDVPDALRGECDRLREQRDGGREDWLEARLALGEHAEVLAELRHARRVHPYRERMIALEMHALYCAGRTADSLVAFTEARRQLDQDLGLEPGPELYDLQRAILAHDPALLAGRRAPADGATLAGATGHAPSPGGHRRPRHNLPQLSTPLIGRELELQDLCRRLISSPARLMTLIGPGGVGKTRLAIACGERLLERFSGGVFLVALAPVTDAAGLMATMVDVLEVQQQPRGDEASLVEHLAGLETLLIVDNFEHLLDAAPLLGRLLDAAPGLRVLVTSQAPLHLRAESIVPLAPLRLPERGETDAARLADVPAIRLFVERARAADPSFALRAADAGAVVELCSRLDGLPLALELAAARVRLAGVAGVLDALVRGLDPLGRGARDLPERQRGLRAALDFTVSLLDHDARELFIALGAFADAWTLEQADAAFGDELDVWEGMQTLSDFSLVRAGDDGALTMTERIRTHARELLHASGRLAERRRRHAELMGEAAQALTVRHAREHAAAIVAARRLRDEFEHAISWSRDADQAAHRRLIAGTARLLFFDGRLARIADDIDRLADADVADDVTAGWIMSGKAMLQCQRGDMPGTALWASRAAACHRATADREILLATLTLTAHAHTLAGDGEAARAVAAEGLALTGNDTDPRFRDLFEGTLAFAAVADEDYEQAETRLQAILAQPGRTDFAAVAAPSYLANCAVGRGDGELALRRYRHALDLAVARGELTNTVMQLTGVAASLALLKRHAEAARLVGAIDHVQRDLGTFRGWHGVLAADAILESLPAQMGSERWSSERATGTAMTLDQAVEFARAVVMREPPAVS